VHRDECSGFIVEVLGTAAIGCTLADEAQLRSKA
jgi:hypothetical protein